MNDRELLELAAKAAGFSVDRFSRSDNYIYTNSLGKWWSPLMDDGDALRLAVKLRIEIGVYPASGYCTAEPLLNGKKVYCYLRDVDQNECAATRRAIARAAAEIGRSMQ